MLDHHVLNQLPENASVADRLPVCREGGQDGTPAVSVGPDAAADDDAGDVNEQFVGGGGGGLDFGNPDRPEVEQLRRGAAAAIRGPRSAINKIF